MSSEITRWMLLWLTPVLALTSIGRPVIDAHLIAQAAMEAAARPDSGSSDDDGATRPDVPVIGCADDPWDRVVRAGGPMIGVEPITIATSYCEPPARPTIVCRCADDESADYTPARQTHLACLWACGPPVA